MTVLFILFISFILFLNIFIFHIAFVKGEIFDITKMKFGKRNNLNKSIDEFKTSIDWISNLPYELQSIKSDDGLKLVAKLYKMNASNKMVILFHGYRSIAQNDFILYFKWFYEQGYNILLVDQRAHGESEGKYITFGVKEKQDCVRWCEWAEVHFSEIDEIILCGMSMGATTVLLASGCNLPTKVKKLVADSSFTSAKNILWKVINYKFGIDMNALFPTIKVMCKYIAKFNLEDGNALDAMRKNKLPVLFVHALGDDFVPSKMSKENYNACIAKKSLVLVDCMSHGFACAYQREKVYDALKNFLNS